MRFNIFAAVCSAVLLAACGTPSETTDPEPPAGELDVAPDPAAPPVEGDASVPVETGPDNEALVQPEWDALDRVQDSCGLAVVRGFLGRMAPDIPEDRLPEQFRILAPTDQATMDYVPRRLNVLTDEEGTVIGFKCG